MRTTLLSAAICTFCTLGAVTPSRADTVDTTGASVPLAPLSWGRVQGRLAFATNATPLRTDLQASDTAFKVSSLSFMGDYYLRPSLSQLTLGGLRATSGILFGQRSALWGQSSSSLAGFGVDRRYTGRDDNGNYEHTSTPYVGLGYSGTGGTYGKSGSWGFSADFGLMSLSPGNIGRFGKVLNGSQNLDDMVRDLRLSPVLQFGFSYAF